MSYKKLDLYSTYLEYFDIESVEAMPIFLKTKEEADVYYSNYVDDFVDDEYVKICKENIDYLVNFEGLDYYDIYWDQYDTKLPYLPKLLTIEDVILNTRPYYLDAYVFIDPDWAIEEEKQHLGYKYIYPVFGYDSKLKCVVYSNEKQKPGELFEYDFAKDWPYWYYYFELSDSYAPLEDIWDYFLYTNDPKFEDTYDTVYLD